MSEQPTEEWLSVEDVAKILKMDDETVRRWIRTKQLKAYKFGRNFRIRRSDLDKFIEDRSFTE